ncbi:MAG: replication initiation protein [Aquabacterium sp.]
MDKPGQKDDEAIVCALVRTGLPTEVDSETLADDPPARTPVRRQKASRKRALAKVEVIDPREFRKTNEAIGLRVREGRLSLLTRKVFNVMMYHAQELKTPGLNAPIDTPAARKYFWIPLAELARDAAYDSKDTEFLKQQLEELQNIKLLMENERQWTSERLVSSVTLVNPQGLKKHAGQVWFGYAFPPEVHELVMAPGTYTRFSIVYQGLLRSGAALALYEVCRRYATNPSRLTSQESYGHWYGVLTGNPLDERDELPPYKYFKRDVIHRAVTEINALTDIQVELIEHKNGRRVEQLQFRVEPTRQPQLAFPAPPVIDVQLMERLMKLGMTQQEAADLMAAHGDAKLRGSLAFVEARMAQAKAAPLASPAAFLRWALKDGTDAVKAVETRAPRTAVGPSPRAKGGSTIMDAFLAARAREALAVYSELGQAAQQEVFERFKAQSMHKHVQQARGVDTPMVRSLFSTWLARDLWGEPSAQALAQFIEASNP